jgi:hypothetical protein
MGKPGDVVRVAVKVVVGLAVEMVVDLTGEVVVELVAEEVVEGGVVNVGEVARIVGLEVLALAPNLKSLSLQLMGFRP